jgi:predicted phage-related endonuclease
MRPLVMVDGDYSASLDGLTLAGDRIVEIKCPLKGRDSTLWKTIAAGRLPEHYQYQVQHQLMVTKADIADVFVFDGTEGVVFPIAPDPSCWPRIHEAWHEFAALVASKARRRYRRATCARARILNGSRRPRPTLKPSAPRTWWQRR